jgi:hypothetical protein
LAVAALVVQQIQPELALVAVVAELDAVAVALEKTPLLVEAEGVGAQYLFGLGKLI